MSRNETCNAHSGLVTWMKVNTAILTVASGLFSYSVFVQAPDLKMQIVKESNRLDNERDRGDRDAAERIGRLEQWRNIAETRFTTLEGK